MENYECAVGRTTKDYDADYERVAGRNGLDQAYGYDVPEKNGEQENHSLCRGRKGKIILFRPGPERSGDSGRAEFLKPGIQGQPGTDDDNHVRAGETYG